MSADENKKKQKNWEENKRSLYLLCVVAFWWMQVGLVWRCCVSALLLPLQHSAECTVQKWQDQAKQTPLKCYTSVERGSKRELRLSGPLISLLWPAPTLFLLFPPQIVSPYLGDGREGKNKTCDFRVWCGHWKEFSEFHPLPLKNKMGLGGQKGGRDDQILEWSLTEHGKGSSSN